MRVPERGWVGTVGLLLVGAALLIDAAYAISMIEPPPTVMELCLAGEAQERLCLDPLWREHWRPDCDLCLPGMLSPPSQGVHDAECRRRAMMASCSELIARFPGMWDSSIYRTRRVPRVLRLETACGIVLLAFGLVLVLRRVTPRRV